MSLSLTALFWEHAHITASVPMVRDKPLPHHPLDRKAKELDFRHRGGTKCRCPYCVQPYNRAQSRRDCQAEIDAYFTEDPA